MRTVWKKGAAVVLSMAVAVSSGTVVPPLQSMPERALAASTGTVQPDYELDFESASAVSLKGTAKIETGAVSINGTKYSKDGNHILTLAGGSKGSSYVELPSDLYKGVSSDTGFSYSFWLKSASNVGSYSRLISSAKKVVRMSLLMRLMRQIKYGMLFLTTIICTGKHMKKNRKRRFGTTYPFLSARKRWVCM